MAKPIHILAVDDEESFTFFVKLNLENEPKARFRVTTAATGEEGLAVAARIRMREPVAGAARDLRVVGVPEQRLQVTRAPRPQPHAATHVDPHAAPVHVRAPATATQAWPPTGAVSASSCSSLRASASGDRVKGASSA